MGLHSPEWGGPALNPKPTGLTDFSKPGIKSCQDGNTLTLCYLLLQQITAILKLLHLWGSSLPNRTPRVHLSNPGSDQAAAMAEHQRWKHIQRVRKAKFGFQAFFLPPSIFLASSRCTLPKSVPTAPSFHELFHTSHSPVEPNPCRHCLCPVCDGMESFPGHWERPQDVRGEVSPWQKRYSAVQFLPYLPGHWIQMSQIPQLSMDLRDRDME